MKYCTYYHVCICTLYVHYYQNACLQKFYFAVLLALVIDCISVVLDIIVLAVWYPHEAKSSEQFSAVMAIFNLIFRFASIYILYQCWRERNEALHGIYGTNPSSYPAPQVTNNTTTAVRSPSRVSQRPADTSKDNGK